MSNRVGLVHCYLLAQLILRHKDTSGNKIRMGFSLHWSWFGALLCLFNKGDVVWCDCSLDGMQIEEGNYTLTNGLNDGSILRYQCAEGHYPYPELAYRCQRNNRWDPQPQRRRPRCRMVECPDPTVLQNGYISPIQESRKYYYQTQITYQCYSGYTLFGPSQRTCLNNGKWSGSNSVCRRDSGDCPDPGVPPGGSRSGNTFEIGDKVVFKCRSNMILIGSEERECQLNGQWSGKEPSCYYKYTYDSPWEVSEAFGGEIKHTLTAHTVEKTQEGRTIKLTRGGILNIFIALDISESINDEDYKNAKKAVTTLIKKIENFSVYPNYEVVFFSSKIHTVIDILDFYGASNPPTLNTLLDKFEKFKIKSKDKVGTNLSAVFGTFLEKIGIIKIREANFSEHQHVIILFTDGGYNMGGAPTETVERIKSTVYMGQPEQRKEHLDIYIFGIGTPVYDDVLKPLAFGTGKRHYFKLTDLEKLHETFDEIIDEADITGLCGLYRDLDDIDETDSKEKRKKFPWVVYISATVNGNTKYCLGSLVSPRFILTAAHCFNNNSGVKVDVSEKQLLVVKKIHKHPKYNIFAKVNQGIREFYDYDVALIELEEDAPITISLRPICIPCTQETNAALRNNFTCKRQEEFLIKDNERVTFLTKKALKENEARVKLGDNRYGCIEKALKAPNITVTDVTQAVTENFLCTGGLFPYLDHVSCKGDSGGAVFRNYEGRTIQMALVSWGTKQMPGCKDGIVESDKDSRDFHINLFKVVPFLKSFLGIQNKTYAPLLFVD